MVFSDCSVLRVRGNLPGDRVDEDINRFWERRSALNMVVADQAEDSSLRKYGRVVVDRTIKEVEDDTGCDAIAVDVLGDVANRDAGTV